MYYGHFGLTQPPFRITPNTDFFFSGGNRGPILEALVYAVSHGEGIIKVTGEVGSGKTMLCNMLQARLPAHVETIYLANPAVPPDEILHAIAFELQLEVGGKVGRIEVMQAINQHLVRLHAEGKRVVAFLEESQGIPPATLEEIRLLSNLETAQEKLLQIVLFGQPELDDNLRRPDMRPLRERIAQSFLLEPLAVGEIHEYLMFRMRTAGYRGPDLFSPSVVKRISRASEGLTRRINLIADKALLAAFSENTHTIRSKHVDAAVRDSEFSRRRSAVFDTRYAWGTVLLLAGVVLGAASYALIQHSGNFRPGSGPDLREGPVSAAPTEHPGASASDSPAAGTMAGQNAADSKKKYSKTNTYSVLPALESASAESAIKIAETPAETTTHAMAGAPSDRKMAAPEGSADVVHTRLAATRQWLTTAQETAVSIQMMGTDNETQLEHDLKALSQVVEMNRIFVYRTMAKQKPALTVLYGSFDNFHEAQKALEKLPPLLKANRPILRTVQGIRTEINRYHTF